MKNLEYILSIAGTALGLLITAITYIIKFVKSEKVKKLLQAAEKIGNAVLPFIQQAETFVNYTGAEKKEFVLTKANQFALDNKIPFDANMVVEKIEELVALTKTVNARDKDKVA